MFAKLGLGTVQFGMAYGINNANGQVASDDVRHILQRAYAAGIKVVDTAAMYGDAEVVLGDILQGSSLSFDIVSKVAENVRADGVLQAFQETLRRLRCPALYGYLIHDINALKADPAIWDVCRQLRKEGRVQKIGISLYYPADLLWLLERGIVCDIVQVPYNVFDQRFADIFPLLRQRHIEIHTRSVFLQGLFFVPEHELIPHFAGIKAALRALHELARQAGIPLHALLINFALHNPLVDTVILGVDSVGNFQENLNAFEYSRQYSAYHHQVEQFAVDDEQILLPFHWT